MLKNTLSIQNQPKSLSLNALIRDGTKIASQSVSQSVSQFNHP